MNLVAHQWDFACDVSKLIEYIRNYNGNVMATFGEAYRTQDQQSIYYSQGKSKTLNSKHSKRLAIDLNFIKDGKMITDREQLKPYGIFWESLNPLNRWGGFFTTITDCPHFERNV